MYVCLCKGITQKQLEQAVEQGKGYAQVRQSLGLGTECGCCAQNAKQMIRDQVNNLPPCEFANVG